MRARSLIPSLVVALVAVTACSSAASTPAPTQAPATTAPTESQAAESQAAPSQEAPSQAASAGTLTLWLMKGSVPDDTVATLNAEFEAAHPGWKVDYQVQNWDGIVTKLTTSLAGANPPDVVEMGNTQAATFEAAGALSDLTSQREYLGGGTSADSASPDQKWLASLNESSIWQGKLYAVPFYAGDRVLIYRKDLFQAAGIDPASLTSKDKLIAAAKTLQDKNKAVTDFSGFYVAGQNWYQLLQYIWDRGGDVATNDNGTWKGTLESPEAMQGIQDYVDYYKAGSTGPKDNDEMNPPEYDVFHQGKAGMFVGNLWEIGSAVGTDGKLTADQVGAMAIPGAADPSTVPVFLGGSDLGIAAGSKNQQQALDWIKLLNTDKYQQLLIKAGDIPAQKSAAATIGSDTPFLQIGAAEAAKNSKFTPNDPRWAAVEANNPIKAMLTQVLSGQSSVSDAAKAADQQINQLMNTPL